MSSRKAAQLERAVVSPLLLFLFVYFGVSAAIVRIGSLHSVRDHHLAGLVSVVVATLLAAALFEGRDWLRVRSPRLRELAMAGAIGVFVIGAADVAAIVTGRLEHGGGAGFPLAVVMYLLLPAALHEELLFRGFAFRTLGQWHVGFAILLTSLLFVIAHVGNRGVTPLALLNIFLGGLLLGLVRIWSGLPAAFVLHSVWNLMSAVVLGHEISGIQLRGTVLTTLDRGPEWLTGGSFGIEGSGLLTLTLTLALMWLSRRNPTAAWRVSADAPSSQKEETAAR